MRLSVAPRHRGMTYLEVQIAFAVLGIALAGLAPIVMTQLRLMSRIEGYFPSSQVQYLVPSADPWARKVGVSAQRTTVDPGGVGSSPNTTTPAYEVSIVSLSSSYVDDTAQATVQLTTIPSQG